MRACTPISLAMAITLPFGIAFPNQRRADGGHALAVYREPVGDHWQIFCLLPMSKVEPTPYQRELSKLIRSGFHAR